MRLGGMKPGWMLALAAALGVPAAARAEEPKAKPAGAVAKELYDQASALFKEKKFEQALTAYRELLEKHKSQTAVATKIKEINARIEECEVQMGVVRRPEQVFKGKVQLNKNVLKLEYDFSNEEQLKDFDPFSAEGKIVDGMLELSTPMGRSYFFWNLKNAIFQDSVTVDMEVMLPEGSESEICVSTFFTYENWSGYRFSLHYNDGDIFSNKNRYINVIRKEADKNERDWGKNYNLASVSKPVMEPGKKYRWKIVCRGGVLQMLLNNAPLLSEQNNIYRSGKLRFGGGGSGAVRFGNIKIEGQVNPEWLRKAFSEAETLATRKKLESELQEKDIVDMAVLDALSVEEDSKLKSVNKAALDDFAKGKENHLVYESARGFAGTIIINGKRYETKKVLDEAIKLYTSALKVEPGFAAALVRRAQCWGHKAEEDKALEDLTSAITKYPDFYEAYKERGDVLVGRGALPEAMKDYDKALEIKADYGRGLAARAYLRFMMGEREKSFAEIEAAHKQFPDDVEIKRIHRNLKNVVSGPPWRKEKTFVKETEHYIVKSDISEQAVVFYAAHLEAIRKLFSEKFGYKADSKEKARAYVFETKEGYMTYAELSTHDRPEFTLGYYHPHYRELLLFDHLDREQTLRVLYHEGFHQFLHGLLSKPPYWFNEGVAEYFGASKVEGGRVTATGLVQEGRLNNIKMMLQYGDVKKFADLVKAASRQEFYSGNVAGNYAQAWSIVHFLFNHDNGKYFPLLRDYYKSIRDGNSFADAFKASFGKANLAALDEEWRKYVEKLDPPKK